MAPPQTYISHIYTAQSYTLNLTRPKFTRPPNLHDPQIYTTHIYTLKFTQPQIYTKFTRPLIYINQIYTPPNLLNQYSIGIINSINSICSINSINSIFSICSMPSIPSIPSVPTIPFSLDPSYRRGRVYKRKFCLFVCLSVIASTFPLYDVLDHTNHTFSESSWSKDI